MDRPIWVSERGYQQGRLTPAGWAPPREGAYAHVFGSDSAGVFRRLRIGDYIEIRQTATPTALSTLFRASLRIRPPTTMPLGTLWLASLSIAGTTFWSQELATLRTRDFNDVAANIVALLGSDRTFIWRLELGGSGDPTEDFEVELPGVYIDALLFDLTTARPVLINRDPEPDQTKIRIDSNVALDITDPGGQGISLPDTKVYIDGVLAFDAGVFQTGYTGPDSATSGALSFTRSIVIDPVDPLEGTTTHTVRVVSKTLVSLLPLDVSYVFLTEDTNAPSLVTVAPSSLRTIVVTFSEDVTQDDPTDPDDALNPDNYAISIVQPDAPDFVTAVTLEVISVASNGTGSVILTTDIDMTPGAPYRLTGSNLTDIYGNSIGPPTDTLDFTGWLCPTPDGRAFQLIDMLPDFNLDEDATLDLSKFVAIYQEVTDIQLCDVDDWFDILDPDTALIQFVEAMLYDLGNPFAFDLSDIDKRRLVQLLVPIYKQKGTDSGIINAIRFFLGIEVTISVPAFEGILGLGTATIGGTWKMGTSALQDRLTFDVNVPLFLTETQRAQMDAIVTYMKYAPTHHRIIEPSGPPPVIDHLSLGYSKLGVNWRLHS